MPKNCARCRAENVVQASECASCGARFGKGQPGTEPPASGPASSKGCVVWVLAFAVLAAAGSWIYERATGGGADADRSGQDVPLVPDAEADVKMHNCRVGEYGWGEAWVIITNGTRWTADYFVTVAFESEDGARRYGDAIGSVRNLEPGQKSRIKLASTDDFPGGTCRVVEVRRSPM